MTKNHKEALRTPKPTGLVATKEMMRLFVSKMQAWSLGTIYTRAGGGGRKTEHRFVKRFPGFARLSF